MLDTTAAAPSSLSKGLIARQPIVNGLQQIIGYELFNRSRSPYDHTMSSDATLIFAALTHAGEEDLVGTKLMFVNCTHEGLTGEHLELLPADKVVLESSLSFAMAIQKLLVKNEACRLAGLYLFWNMVDGREKTDLYTAYDKTIKELELPLMKTFIPDTKRYKKELVADKKAVFRSTLFPASRPLVRGSNLEELITEIVYYIKLK